jgi:segregation and condensation protein A
MDAGLYKLKLYLMIGLPTETYEDLEEMLALIKKIKARMLLPREIVPGDEEPEDPRRELVNRLLEYQQIREAAAHLGRLEQSGRHHFFRGYTDHSQLDPSFEDRSLEDLDLMSLARAWLRVHKRQTLEHYHEVEGELTTVEEQIRLIRGELRRRPYFTLDSLLNINKTRNYLVVTFLALLDLVREKKLAIRQRSAREEIWIFHPTHLQKWEVLYRRF